MVVVVESREAELDLELVPRGVTAVLELEGRPSVGDLRGEPRVESDRGGFAGVAR